MRGVEASSITLGATTLLFILHLTFGAVIGIEHVAASWDLAVTIGKEIDFIGRNGNLTETTSIANASNFVGIAYDDTTNTLFLSDADNRNYSIVSIKLTKNATVEPLLKRDKDTQILSMAFDTKSRTLFWTTERSITKMQLTLDARPNGRPVILHNLETETPRAIALDVCNRNLYWVNGNRSRPSIMRSRLDGSDPRLLITDNLYEPSSIVVDHTTGKLYWLDDEEGIHYKLEQSDLDGSERSVLVHGKHQQPLHLAVDRDRLYWTDYVYRAVWEIGKEPGPTEAPRKFRSYYESGSQADPTGLLTRDNLGGKIDCRQMQMASANRAREAIARMTTTTTTVAPIVRVANNMAGSGERIECFNGDIAVNSDGSGANCRCWPGYGGSRCEISACHNYCLNGECQLSNNGQPICACKSGYSGQRCERELCDGFCLNNGRCVLDEENRPTCECKYSSGARCEVTLEMAEICALYCMNRQFQMPGLDTSSCRCSELNETIEEVLGYDTFNCTLLVPLLSGLLGMLTIAVILLSVYVTRLRRRPRIKKRFVVNKAGITPLTSRPSPIAGDQQCEITIENCCNMNICETPCFEPKLRSASSGRSTSKKEEKSNLLDHMEDGPGSGC